jgi:hypothetical protein
MTIQKTIEDSKSQIIMYKLQTNHNSKSIRLRQRPRCEAAGNEQTSFCDFVIVYCILFVICDLCIVV